MMLTNRKTDIQNERGAALLLTMMLMLVLSLLTVSLYEMLQASTQITGNHKLELKASYIADAGVEDAIDRLRDAPGLTGDFSVEFPAGSGNTYAVEVVRNVDVSGLGSPVIREVVITSTGTSSGFSRKLQVHLHILEWDDSGSTEYAVSTESWQLVALP